MNKFKILAATMAVISFSSLTAGAAPYASITNGVMDTPRENVFRVSGSNQEFVLLDVTDDDNSKYFVFAKDYYTKRAYGSVGQEFNPHNPLNIGYRLNNQFLTEGFEDSLTKKIYKMPDGIIKHIDMNHVWETEGGAADSSVPTRYSFTAGVALLSQEEFIKYQDKIGMQDDLDSLMHGTRFSGWWLRTGTNSDSNMISVKPASSPNATGGWGNTDAGLHIRPAFYLDSDFFGDVPIVLSEAGENVKALFKERYTIGELKDIYPVSDIYDYLGYLSPVGLHDVSISVNGQPSDKINGANSITVKGSAKNNMKLCNDVIVVGAVYTSNGIPKKMVSESLEFSSLEEKDFEFSINPDFEVKDGYYLKIYTVKKNSLFESVSNSVKFYCE